MADNTIKWLAILLLGVVVLHVTGVVDFKAAISGEEPAEGDGDGVVAGVCTDPSNTMTIGPQYTRWATTAQTSENVGYWNNGVYRGSQSDGAAVTVGNGDKIELLYGLDSSTFYMNYATFTAPCKPFSSSEYDGQSNELITADVDYTLRAFNGDDGLVNAATANETIGSGETGSWRLEIEGASEQAISPHGKAWLVVGYEKNNFTSSDILLDGKEPSGTIPSYFTTNDRMNYKVFKIDGCPIKQGTKQCILKPGILGVKAKDGVNPAQGTDGNLGNFLNITVLNEDYDVNTNTNQIMGDPSPVIEDNDGTRSGFASDGLMLHIA